ncbi:hypothetical protein TNCV_4769901 [Trichonephila clavipes]|nr:hypothetical protein TNCV_4769901 [Trichonephila clavipes]
MITNSEQILLRHGIKKVTNQLLVNRPQATIKAKIQLDITYDMHEVMWHKVTYDLLQNIMQNLCNWAVNSPGFRDGCSCLSSTLQKCSTGESSGDLAGQGPASTMSLSMSYP